jgi:large subunit ribosomal protein L13
LSTPTVSIKDVKKRWYLVDAKDKVLGRLASRIAQILIGKHKPTYVHYLDVGDFIVVVNAEKVQLTGRKMDNKIYYRHSSYPGGLKKQTPRDVLKKYPERLIKHAVKGMIPKNKMQNLRMKKLKIYVGENHPHSAQKPEKIEF